MPSADDQTVIESSQVDEPGKPHNAQDPIERKHDELIEEASGLAAMMGLTQRRIEEEIGQHQKGETGHGEEEIGRVWADAASGMLDVPAGNITVETEGENRQSCLRGAKRRVEVEHLCSDGI